MTMLPCTTICIMVTSCKKDDLILTSAYPANVQAIAYDKTITASHKEAVQDGEDFMHTTNELQHNQNTHTHHT